MKKDVVVIYSSKDQKLINDLKVELDLLGVDAAAETAKPGTIKHQLQSCLADHAMPVLLVTEALLQGLEESNAIIRKVPSAVAILGFRLDKASREKGTRLIPDIKHSSAASAP